MPEALNGDRGRHLRRQDLEHNGSAERHLFGEEYAAHASTTELSLDGERVAEGRLQLLVKVSHYLIASRRRRPILGRLRRAGQSRSARLTFAA